MEMRSSPVVEAPLAVQHTRQLATGQRGNGVDRSEAAFSRIGFDRHIDGWGLGIDFTLDVQRQVVGQLRGKDDRSPVRRQNQARLQRAVFLLRTYGVQHRRLGRTDRGKGDNDNRLGIAERRGNVEAQIECVFGGQRQRRDVLEMGRMQRRKNSGRIQDCAYIGAEFAAAAHGGIAQLVHQVAGCAVGQLRHQRLRVGIVQHQSVGVLHQAGRLLVGGLVKALLVDLDAQGARQVLGAHLQQLWIGQGSGFHLGQVGLQAHTVEAGCLQILGRPHKGAGAVAHGSAQRCEIPARLRSQKDQRLLRFSWNSDENTFLPRLATPGLHARKPLRRRRVCDPAQEGNNQNIMGRLALRKIGMNPQPVPWFEVRHLADGQSRFPALHTHVHLGTCKIECRGVGGESGRGKENEQQERQETTHSFYCTNSGV